VELHCHSAFSFLEGASTPLELILTARKLGYRTLALTDHDNLAGAMEFAQTAKEWEVKPIIGAEVTLQGGAHLTLLAETRQGYANLSRLLSNAHLTSPRNEPTLDPDMLAEHAEGLICLSGCREGELSKLVAGYDIDGAKRAARHYRELFGRESFFIELQNNLVYGDEERIRCLVEIAQELGIGVVATNNVHYHERSRHRLQDVLVAVRHRTTLDASEHLRRTNANFYLKSPREMASLFADLPEAIDNTRVIAERCEFDLTRDLNYQFPDYEAPDGKTADEFLKEVCRAGAYRLYGMSPQRSVFARLDEELALIRQVGHAGFFLRLWELMQYAHKHDLPARGRGSSVGSLVCYLLGLSGIDPIKYNLFVGRFLNEARQSEDVPDIDIDFAREARERMFEHTFETYGPEYAALVANVIQYRHRQAIRDVGKALGLPEADIDKLAKRIGSRFARSLDEEMRALPEFRARMDSPLWREFRRLVEELVGKPRHLGQHSGGVILSSEPLIEQVPVQPSAMAGRYICQWDKDSVADAGIIKLDLLGYPSLGHLDRALKMIEEQHGVRVDPVRIPLDDPKVYEMVQWGDILGIVQIQSRAQLQTIRRLKISCIEDLVIQVALIRPGPIQGGAVNPYIARCQGVEPVTYDHECLRPVLEETKGVIVFQEQVLEVAIAVAGFTAGQAETLRRAMSRKRSREEMEKLHEEFLEGARRTGHVDEPTAQRIYEKVLAFAEFGFPKAHAAAMAETAAKLAWVKCYYKLIFYCAWLNEWPFGFYSPGVIVNEARRNGVELLGVDVNHSRAECAIEGDAIRLGYRYVKGFGAAWLERVDEEAENGPYASLWDFWRRTRLSREPIEHLIRLGALSFTGLHERELLWQLDLFYEPLSRQLPLALPYDADMVALQEMTNGERVREDIVLTEGAITTRGHIMDLASIHEGITPSHIIERLEGGTPVSVAGFVAVRQAPQTAKGFVFHTLEDRYGLINIITKPKLVERYKELVAEAGALIVHGHIERQERAVNVMTESMELLPLNGARVPSARTHNFG
ncbi:MAG: error-prone DNA polymerase, partial [Dehalococcoidia bacterium]